MELVRRNKPDKTRTFLSVYMRNRPRFNNGKILRNHSFKLYFHLLFIAIDEYIKIEVLHCLLTIVIIIVTYRVYWHFMISFLTFFNSKTKIVHFSRFKILKKKLFKFLFCIFFLFSWWTVTVCIFPFIFLSLTVYFFNYELCLI